MYENGFASHKQQQLWPLTNDFNGDKLSGQEVKFISSQHRCWVRKQNFVLGFVL